MSYLVVLVLDDPDEVYEVLRAWEDAGAKGITILESSGVGRVRQAGFRDDIAIIPSLTDILKGSETHHRTLFSVVETEEKADHLVQATESTIGKLDQPNKGLLFVVSLLKVFGLTK
jgi:nitrogen regulatory protein PII